MFIAAKLGTPVGYLEAVVAKGIFYQLQLLSQLWPLLVRKQVAIVVHALITFRLDYYSGSALEDCTEAMAGTACCGQTAEWSAQRPVFFLQFASTPNISACNDLRC